MFDAAPMTLCHGDCRMFDDSTGGADQVGVLDRRLAYRAQEASVTSPI